LSASAATSRTHRSGTFAARRLTPALGARIEGVDLAGDMTERTFRALYDAFLAYQVLLFPPQDVPPASQVSLARRFGEVQIHVMNQYHADGHPELYRLSNSTRTASPTAAIRTRARSRGIRTARGGGAPARRRSSTAK
jgi:taurine dioxygenase